MEVVGTLLLVGRVVLAITVDVLRILSALDPKK